jgi:hypothetical protein
MTGLMQLLPSWSPHRIAWSCAPRRLSYRLTKPSPETLDRSRLAPELELLICLSLAALACCGHTCKASLDTTTSISHICIPSTFQHERSKPARARGDDH